MSLVFVCVSSLFNHAQFKYIERRRGERERDNFYACIHVETTLHVTQLAETLLKFREQKEKDGDTF